MDKVDGVIQEVVEYRASATSFILNSNGKKYYAVGSMPIAHQGMSITLYGEIGKAGISAEYIKFTDFEVHAMATAQDMLLFLQNVSGVGEKTAAKIISTYKEDTYNKVYVNRDLSAVNITDKIKERIISFIDKFTSEMSIYTELKLSALPLLKGAAIFQYISAHPEVNIQHPFEIAKLDFVDISDIQALSAVCDDHEFEIEAYVLTSYKSKAGGTDGLIAKDALLKSIKYRVSRAHIVDTKELNEAINAALDRLLASKIINEMTDSKISLKKIENIKEDFYYRVQLEDMINIDSMREKAKTIFESINIMPSDEQLDAVSAAAEKFAVITGGAGTGKSMLIYAMYNILKNEGLNCVVLAPTGKAADRLNTAGVPAYTIHRKVEFDGVEAARNIMNELDVDAVIVDEASMLDYPTLGMLMDAIPANASITLVGDANQLPPVGIGLPFVYAVNNATHVYRLTRVYRQEGRNGIIEMSSRVLKAQAPKAFNGEVIIKKAECYDDAILLVRDIYKQLIHANTEDYVKRNVMVIAATKMLADKLNETIRYDVLNISRNSIYNEGDKVMQLINNYDKEVFNGEVGFVREIDDDGIQVAFDNKLVIYSKEEYYQLGYAYATTVHKAQGSETKMVIFPLVNATRDNIYKEMVYTAVTRARHRLVLLTNTRDYYTAVKRSVFDK